MIHIFSQVSDNFMIKKDAELSIYISNGPLQSVMVLVVTFSQAFDFVGTDFS